MIQITHNGEHFIATVHFEDRHIVKKAGFRWDKDFREWYTPNHTTAARLREYCDESAKNEINRICLIHRPWLGRIPHPPKLTPYSWQLESAKFALSRNRSYLAMDMRLGKTIVAALMINAEACNAIYICPPSLVETTRSKLQDWLMHGLIATRFSYPATQTLPNVLIIPDSMLTRKTTIEAIRVFHKSSLWNHRLVRLFVDEAHRFKESTSKRSKALYEKIIPLFDKTTFLSGTPMPNRPIELYPVLSTCAPETINYMNKFDYGRRYCAAFKNDFGWDFSGASNVPELASKVIGPFMQRLRKADVIKDLPPTIEEMLIIDDELPPTAARLDEKLLKEFSPEDLMKRVLAPNGHIATYRKELGLAKVEHAVKIISDIMDDTDESLLVFGHHVKAMAELHTALTDLGYDHSFMQAEVHPIMRSELVKDFQQNPKKRIMLANMQVGGLGFDMWKASRVLFVEFDWVPANNEQAIERAWKVDKKENIFVQYLVYKNSVDRAVLEAVFRKKRSTKHI